MNNNDKLLKELCEAYLAILPAVGKLSEEYDKHYIELSKKAGNYLSSLKK